MKKLPVSEMKRRCTSLHGWEIPKQSGGLAPEHVWTNRETDQTWTIGTIMACWASNTINLSAWETVSGIPSVGLSCREAISDTIVANLCVAIHLVLNDAMGAKLHVPFFVLATSGFGYHLRYFCIVSRAILVMICFGFSLGTVVQQHPLNLARNGRHHLGRYGVLLHMPADVAAAPSNVTDQTKIGPHQNAHDHRHRDDGGGGDIFALNPSIAGAECAWLWLSRMSSVTGSWSTVAYNISDFTRRPGASSSSSPSAATSFLAFMGGYAIFIGPMASIMVADYWEVKKQHLGIPVLYDPHGRRYAHTAGCNWRAVVAFLIPVRALLPGLALINRDGGAAAQIKDSVRHLYMFN
ncbi:hypothetical protein PG997_010441 [Apiospora hydei]|uniref:Uncharacterized protein n=1 Tax=Apiospora hydei TaxID=1337664 RepID=A0ABR1VX06_9PEZI